MNFPAARLFWLVLDAPGVRGGALPAGLWSALEDGLPINPELVWAVGAPIDGQRLLVCAALRSDLMTIDAGVLTPDRVLESISNDLALDPELLNLLVGPFEPATARIGRRRRHLMAASAALLGAVLLGVGLERRASVWNEESRGFDSATGSVVASLSPSLGWNRDDLVMELQQRQQSVPVQLNIPRDASEALAGLISRWPIQVSAKPQSISTSGESASVSVLIPPPGQAAAFITAFEPPDGWRFEEPRLVSVDKATRINLEMRRANR